MSHMERIEQHPQGYSTEAPVFTPSVADLAAWLKTQLALTSYCYVDNCGCLLYKYFVEREAPIGVMTSLGIWYDLEGRKRRYPQELDNISVDHPRTYGAALERCHTYLEQVS